MLGSTFSLGLLMHVERVHKMYGAAGPTLAATTTIGQTVSKPLATRWMGVWGMRRVPILNSALGDAGTFKALGLVAGLANPPAQPAVGIVYSSMAISEQLTPLYSIDASASLRPPSWR